MAVCQWGTCTQPATHSAMPTAQVRVTTTGGTHGLPILIFSAVCDLHHPLAEALSKLVMNTTCPDEPLLSQVGQVDL